MDRETITAAVLGAIGGALVLFIIGFAFGGWVRGGTAQKRADEMAEEAVVDRLAVICVEQFNRDSEKDRKLMELKKEESWKRNDYVTKQGWATMPGEKEVTRGVANKCADMLM